MADEEQQEQNYTVTTARLRKKINLDTFTVQFSRAQLRRQIIV